MKKILKIEITENPLKSNSSCVTEWNGDGSVLLEQRLVIGDDGLNHGKAQSMAVILHELGHALGYEIGLPAHKRDFKRLCRGEIMSRVEMIEKEIEAWEVARKIFENFRTYALSTYGYKEEKKDG